jgi:hypothetical protein
MLRNRLGCGITVNRAEDQFEFDLADPSRRSGRHQPPPDEGDLDTRANPFRTRNVRPELADLVPQGTRWMSANPHTNGGVLLQDLRLAGLS